MPRERRTHPLGYISPRREGHLSVPTRQLTFVSVENGMAKQLARFTLLPGARELLRFGADDGKRHTFPVVGAGPDRTPGLDGHRVILDNRTAGHVAATAARGGIQLTSLDPRDAQGSGALHAVTSSMAEALADAEIVMVVVLACVHRDGARLATPCLQDGQVIVLNPGRICGATEFAHTLREE